MPKQAQILMKAIYMMGEKVSSSTISGDKVYNKYREVNRKMTLKPENPKNFSDLASNLETYSIIKVKKDKTRSLKTAKFRLE